MYVFWNYHETEPGRFDFQTGNHNIAGFIRLVQDEGMWVMLRPGPYVCAEWDFGGLPSYLLGIPDIKVRCMAPRYTAAAERYIKALALQIKDLQVTKGGPIIMIQAENEYGSYGNDRDYMRWIQGLWRENDIDIPLYTADGPCPPLLEAGSLSDAAIGLDPGANESSFSQAAQVNSGVPSFCSELYAGRLTHWGEEWPRIDTNVILKDVKWLMDHKKSFNIYVIHGGTNFGWWAGANAIDADHYQPHVTSYDFDAPVNEMGQATPRYMALRELLSAYMPSGQALPEVPSATPVISISEIPFVGTASLWENLPQAIVTPQPKPMEMLGQKSGFILYRTKLTGHKKGSLRVTDLHDYATVFVDGKYIGKLDRSKAENIIELPDSQSKDPQLDILVEGMGRVNYSEYLIDRKGITDRVSLNGMTLMNWHVYPLPVGETFLQNLKYTSARPVQPGIFFRGEFELAMTGDTYLDVSSWSKGVVWVNGHNLGRYWNIGPQNRLYCPAPFLKKGKNTIIIFDLHQTEAKSVTGGDGDEMTD